MAHGTDLAKLSNWQLQELEHYARMQRLRRERGEALGKDDFVKWAMSNLKIGVEYIDYAWNWLLYQFGLR